jgi:transcriptional regulator with XRE-family HTH domain
VVRTIDSPRHNALRAFIIEKRQKAGLRQVDVAKKLGRHQSYVSYVESGLKVIDVVELMEWADAIGFDPRHALKHLLTVSKK